MSLETDQALFREGEHATAVFAVLDGLVKLTVGRQDGREILVEMFHRGTSFAEALAFSDAVYPVSATAIVLSRLVSAPIPAVQNALGANPDGFRAVLASTYRHLHALVKQIRAAGLFRDATAVGQALPRPIYVAVILALVAAFIGVAAWISGIPTLALWSAAGIIVSLGLLALAAQGARALARRLSASRVSRGRPALRLAFGSVGGPGGETVSVVLSLGLGLTVLAAIGQIDSNLRGVIDRDLPDVAPAFFFVDIQTDQLEGFSNVAETVGGADRIETAPMLRGIITRVNDVPAREYVLAATGETHWSLSGDRGVTYASAPPEGAAITEGAWWPEDYDGPPLMSFAEEEGREMGLKIGDRMTVNILGRDITAEIANFRVVEFQNMGINFLIALNPGALAGAPHTHIATVYAGEEGEAGLLRDLAVDYPNITAVR
ncbi:MAG: cyclic nucleotide-binding domain-containing protein, partial [Pseudomonadota bacterium]